LVKLTQLRKEITLLKQSSKEKTKVMAKTGQASIKKVIKAKAPSKQVKSKAISKSQKSAKSTAAPPSPTKRASGKGSKDSKQKWVAPYEKKI